VVERHDGDEVAVIGVRHHSPACARVVADTIERLRPAHVLIEGPVDYTDRLGELTLGHRLPIALFSHARRGTHTQVAWNAYTEFSPEWVAIQAATGTGASVRFIDLPSWHPDFDSGPTEYSPAAVDAVEQMGLDTIDAMWDHVVEARAGALTTEEMRDILDSYFILIRGDGVDVSEREKYMASWVKAAREQGGSVVVVCGGFHRAGIMSELETGPPADDSWPTVPIPDSALDVGSYLIPYSYRRLELEGPWWYQQLWEDQAHASDTAIEAVVLNLRARGHRVSTTDFAGFRTQVHALAAMRGHSVPTRRDVLDGAASTLVDEAIPSPLPWTRAGEPLGVEADPVIEVCIRTLRGERRGELHPDAPAPGLVHQVDMLLEEFELITGTLSLDLTDERERSRSRVLHQLRLLGIPGFDRSAGPSGVSEVRSIDEWVITDHGGRVPALVEAAAYGHTLVDAAGAALVSALRSAGKDMAAVARILFDAVLSGLDDVSDTSASAAIQSLDTAVDLADTGLLLRTALDLWRHDSLFGSRGSALLGEVVAAASPKVLTLARRVRATGGADLRRIAAVAAIADAMQYAGHLLRDDPSTELDLLARDSGAAVDMRGSALGASWTRTTPEDAAVAVRSIPSDRLGDWLSGLFGVARERFLDAGSGDAVLTAVDAVVGRMTEHDFLTALPALRQSFEFFPPREREVIARRVAPAPAGPSITASGLSGELLDERVDRALANIGLQ
jgi:hypothetical protein